MSSFEDRKDAFEKKYAHDQEMMFKVEARCSKIFGLWVAGQLGLQGADADRYAKDVIGANLEEAGFDDIKRKVKPDLEKKGVKISDHLLDAQLDKCLKEARQQLLEEGK
jgi:hypothetical protein